MQTDRPAEDDQGTQTTQTPTVAPTTGPSSAPSYSNTCDDGNHGCDTDSTVCLALSGNGQGEQHAVSGLECRCLPGFDPLPSSLVACTAQTTAVPTKSPTLNPTQLAAIVATEAPTTMPTALPTSFPTAAICADGPHGCDLATTDCLSFVTLDAVRTSVIITCVCKEGFRPDPSNVSHCMGQHEDAIPTPIPPTSVPTAVPTAAPTVGTPCTDGDHGCDALSTVCVLATLGATGLKVVTCECRDGYSVSSESTSSCKAEGTPAPSAAPAPEYNSTASLWTPAPVPAMATPLPSKCDRTTSLKQWQTFCVRPDRNMSVWSYPGTGAVYCEGASIVETETKADCVRFCQEQGGPPRCSFVKYISRSKQCIWSGGHCDDILNAEYFAQFDQNSVQRRRKRRSWRRLKQESGLPRPRLGASGDEFEDELELAFEEELDQDKAGAMSPYNQDRFEDELKFAEEEFQELEEQAVLHDDQKHSSDSDSEGEIMELHCAFSRSMYDTCLWLRQRQNTSYDPSYVPQHWGWKRLRELVHHARVTQEYGVNNLALSEGHAAVKERQIGLASCYDNCHSDPMCAYFAYNEEMMECEQIGGLVDNYHFHQSCGYLLGGAIESIASDEAANGTDLDSFKPEFEAEVEEEKAGKEGAEKQKAEGVLEAEEDEHDRMRLEFLAVESSVKTFLMGFFVFMKTEDGFTLYDAPSGDEIEEKGSCAPCVDGYEVSPHNNHECQQKASGIQTAASGCTEVQVIGPIALGVERQRQNQGQQQEQNTNATAADTAEAQIRSSFDDCFVYWDCDGDSTADEKEAWCVLRDGRCWVQAPITDLAPCIGQVRLDPLLQVGRRCSVSAASVGAGTPKCTLSIEVTMTQFHGQQCPVGEQTISNSTNASTHTGQNASTSTHGGQLEQLAAVMSPEEQASIVKPHSAASMNTTNGNSSKPEERPQSHSREEELCILCSTHHCNEIEQAMHDDEVLHQYHRDAIAFDFDKGRTTYADTVGACVFCEGDSSDPTKCIMSAPALTRRHWEICDPLCGFIDCERLETMILERFIENRDFKRIVRPATASKYSLRYVGMLCSSCDPSAKCSTSDWGAPEPSTSTGGHAHDADERQSEDSGPGLMITTNEQSRQAEKATAVGPSTRASGAHDDANEQARQAEQAGRQGQNTIVASTSAHEADGQGAQEAEKGTAALSAFLGEHLDPVVGSVVKRNPTSNSAPVAAAELQADEASADDHRGAGRPLVVVAAVGCGAAALIAGVLVVRAWRGLLAPAPPPTTSLLVPSCRSSVL